MKEAITKIYRFGWRKSCRSVGPNGELDTRPAKRHARLARLLCLALAAVCAHTASASIIYTDIFGSGNDMWGNQSGDWTVDGDSYFAQSPTNNPLTYSLLPFTVSDFTVDIDVNGPDDGGIYLRANADRSQAVLLIIGGMGHTGTGLYWHVGPDYVTVLNPSVSGLFTHTDQIHVRVVVSGNTYAAYLNGGLDPVTTLIDNSVSSGFVGLYDNTGGLAGQRFDEIVLSVEIPEASTVTLMALGLAFVVISKRRRLAR